MLTRTTVSAIRSLIYLERCGQDPVPPKKIAQTLGESPSYLAKVLGQLARAGILRASRGARGGVRLARAPGVISLLAIVEACQGVILGDFCRETRALGMTCAYHQAMAELHKSIIDSLSHWNLAQLAAQPRPRLSRREHSECIVRWVEAEARRSRQRRPAPTSGAGALAR